MLGPVWVAVGGGEEGVSDEDGRGGLVGRDVHAEGLSIGVWLTGAIQYFCRQEIESRKTRAYQVCGGENYVDEAEYFSGICVSWLPGAWAWEV